MFVKFGNEANLKKLRDKGELYFSPAKVFIDYEKKEGKKGVGYCKDSALGFGKINVNKK